MTSLVRSLARGAPWFVKLSAKIFLSRSARMRRWATSLGGFDHGAMDQADYVNRVVQGHLERCARSPRGGVFLELGPGDSVGSCLVLAALGAERTYLVDDGAFADADVSLYRQMASDLHALGIDAPDLSGARHLDDVLVACRAVYLTEGVRSLSTIPTGSVDASWSHAVLEHINRGQFDALAGELHRVHRRGTRSSHRVDLKDHLDGGLNNLRFPEWLWESATFRQSGFYTNRMRADDIVTAFEGAGFEVVDRSEDRWPALPLPRRRMAEPFRSTPTASLLVSGLDVVMQAM